MTQTTTLEDQYVSVARAAALLNTTQAAVIDMVQHNEIESLILIPTTSVRALIAGGAQ